MGRNATHSLCNSQSSNSPETSLRYKINYGVTKDNYPENIKDTIYTIPRITYGEQYLLGLETILNDPGFYELVIIIDNENIVEESNENNNRLTTLADIL